MMLGECFEKFLARSPVSVMVRGILERVFDPEKLEQVFSDHALLQYTRELTFAHCVELMADVVFRIVPSVGAWYKAHQGEVPVTRQAVYDKLKHLELPTAAGLVAYAGRELRACLQQMPSPPPPLLPGYRVRVLDGNHLAGTEHRVKELRRYRAAALPGHALVFYDPQWEMATDVIPCEDAYVQERALLPEVVPMVAERDCIVADRNFCTLGFLFGVVRRKASFVIRHHAANVVGCPQGPRRGVGHDARGQALYEQTLCVTESDTGETLLVRRITAQLQTPTRDGDPELHILTNLAVAEVPAALIAALYADRWTIETAFQHLTVDLACEVNTLGYPCLVFVSPWSPIMSSRSSKAQSVPRTAPRMSRNSSQCII
jgi:DDE family transposase